MVSKNGPILQKNSLLIRLIEIALVKCDLLQDAVCCRQVYRLDPKPYKFIPSGPQGPQGPQALQIPPSSASRGRQ